MYLSKVVGIGFMATLSTLANHFLCSRARLGSTIINWALWSEEKQKYISKEKKIGRKTDTKKRREKKKREIGVKCQSLQGPVPSSEASDVPVCLGALGSRVNLT